MCMKLPPEKLNSNPFSHTLQTFNTCKIIIMPKVRGDTIFYFFIFYIAYMIYKFNRPCESTLKE